MRLHRGVMDGLAREAPSLRDVQKALQLAIELEHSTIPAYLYAYYSLDPQANAAAAGILKSIAVEEMLHMALAANVLSAIGGQPAISSPQFVPTYPGPLPGGVEGQLVVGLRRLDAVQLDAFIDLEQPRHHVSDAADVGRVGGVTIGEFYLSIAEALGRLGPEVFTGSPRRQIGPDLIFGAVVVSDPASAAAALAVIIEQGEGTGSSPLEVAGYGGNDVAHYYRLLEIRQGRRLVPDPAGRDGYSYTGEACGVDPNGVWALPENPTSRTYRPRSRVAELNDTFNADYTHLLDVLHAFTNGRANAATLERAIGMMKGLDETARALVAAGLDDGRMAGPTFEWVLGVLNPVP